MAPKWTLTLKADGSFEESIENRVMMDLASNGRGTYTRQGNRVTFRGTATYRSDDGYAKDSGTKPIAYDFTHVNGALIQKGRGSGPDMVFRRVGDPAPPSDKPVVQQSDPKAAALLKLVEKRYASLSSYSDEGTMKSSGKGFMAKHAKFTTRLKRPKLFRFEEVLLEAGKVYDKNVVWSDGKLSWLYMGSVGGSDEKGIANALSTISATSGYETMLVPSLLLPKEFKGGSLSEQFKEIVLGPFEKVNNKECQVIQLSNPGRMKLQLWIEAKTSLILRAHDTLADATITYNPSANISIEAKDFKFSPPD